MPRLDLILILGVIGPTPVLAQPTPAQAPAAPPARSKAAERPPAPAFKSGLVVEDRDGAAVGAVKTLTESDRGAVVVIEIDGKLVSVPQSTLRLQGERAVSSQTKAQMLAAAGAPR